MAAFTQELVLVRHGETAWSLSGQHTGRSDIPLTTHGREMAKQLGVALKDRSFAAVFVSPLLRARQTCELAGFADRARICPDLQEWNYGTYEGLTTAQIHAQRPDWSLWRDGCPGGESAIQVGTRADRVLVEAALVSGNVALFAHGHVLRVLAARWLALPPEAGRLFVLSTGRLCTLGFEHEQQALLEWNTPLRST